MACTTQMQHRNHAQGSGLQHPHRLKVDNGEQMTYVERGHTQSSSSMEDALPTSVRGAPPELRRMIRKRQNSESAKRCRMRKKIEDARTAEEIMTQAAKVQRLEAVVQQLAHRLEETQAFLETFSRSPSLCRNGHPKCTGAQCPLCVRDIQAASARIPMPTVQNRMGNMVAVSSQLPNMSLSSSQVPNISVRESQIHASSHGLEKHTQELHMALAERNTASVVELEGNSW